jgi:CelD/BcsL family acetyltransferase involved in cellulose biosynthesis
MEATLTMNTATVSKSVDIECLTSVAAVEAIRNEIDLLSNVPFLRTAWMIPWIKTWANDGDLRFLIVKANGRLVGFAPLVFRDTLKRGRHYAFVGDGKACADYMSFPAAESHEELVLRKIANWLNDDSDHWDRIELDGVTATNRTMQQFVALMQDDETEAETLFELSSYRLQLPKDWDAVLQSLSKNSRKKYRRLSRSLAGSVSLHRATDRSSLKKGLDIFESLHTARWESLGEAGCFGHPGFREFMHATAEQHLSEQKLSLIWLVHDGVPIAADIGFESEHGLYTYQGGISPDHLELEPGRAVLKSQMELAMARGARFIDFLRGDEPYKSRFNTTQIQNVRYEIIGSGFRAKSTQRMLNVARQVKKLLSMD